MSEAMDKANNEIINSLCEKYAKECNQRKRLIELIQFRAEEALELKRSIPDGHTWDREIACSNGLVDILDIIREMIGG